MLVVSHMKHMGSRHASWDRRLAAMWAIVLFAALAASTKRSASSRNGGTVVRRYDGVVYISPPCSLHDDAFVGMVDIRSILWELDVPVPIMVVASRQPLPDEALADACSREPALWKTIELDIQQAEQRYWKQNPGAKTPAQIRFMITYGIGWRFHVYWANALMFAAIALAPIAGVNALRFGKQRRALARARRVYALTAHTPCMTWLLPCAPNAEPKFHRPSRMHLREERLEKATRRAL